jgi:hypothetical protein
MTVNRKSSCQSGFQRVPGGWKGDSSADREWAGELSAEGAVSWPWVGGSGDVTVIKARRIRQVANGIVLALAE